MKWIKRMLIGHFSKKPMAIRPVGDTVPDPVDVEGNEVSVRILDGAVTVGNRVALPITLDVMQAEELAFSILTLVEAWAGLSYTIQRSDLDGPPPPKERKLGSSL